MALPPNSAISPIEVADWAANCRRRGLRLMAAAFFGGEEMNFVWHWPQILWAAVLAFQLGADAARHGKAKKGTHSFGVALVGVGISAAILYFGGFWSGGRLP